ncbi:acyl carrier protein [Pseudoalteromonas ostreae]|uniref:acyl carrier protein n=1 Tax=Pseudoalteromonas ostreae TaxID=2774154 RepID=UPI001B3735D1|nr:acyl carrier protein [Pseudoalteromonas ostreae]
MLVDRGNLTRLLIDILKINDSELSKSFSESGGNSIIAMKFILRAKKESGLEIPIEWLFHNKPISQLIDDIHNLLPSKN